MKTFNGICQFIGYAFFFFFVMSLIADYDFELIFAPKNEVVCTSTKGDPP